MILSVSRRTDIPNYYGDWFFHRLQQGYVYVRNPWNPRQVSKIDLTPESVEGIVFWTKNPRQLWQHLNELEKYPFYVQFTLTGYGRDLEPQLPHKREQMIEIFQNLSQKIGADRIVWRYDPILLNEKYTMDYHRRAFGEIAKCLKGYTDQVTISFIDLYAKTKRNARHWNIRSLTTDERNSLALSLAELAKKQGLSMVSCAEEMDFSAAGIAHGSCIDPQRWERLTGCKMIGRKDPNQRPECRCLESVDIGAYDTCLNGCKYCYANTSEQQVEEKRKQYDKTAALLCDVLKEDDIIKEQKSFSVIKRQLELF